MSLLTLFRAVGTLKRKAQPVSQDASGGMTMVFETITSNLPCDAQAVSAQTRMQYAAQNLAVTHNIYFNRDILARAGDVLDITHLGTTHRFLLQGYTPPSLAYEDDDWPAEWLGLEQFDPEI